LYLFSDGEGIDGGAGGGDDLGGEGIAGDGELAEGEALEGFDDVGLAGGGGVGGSPAAAQGEVGDAVDAGAGIVVVVAAEDDGDAVLDEERLEVVLDGGVVGMAAAGGPAGLMQDDELPGLGGGGQVGLEPVVLGGAGGIGGVLVEHGDVHRAVIEGPVEAAGLEGFGPVAFPIGGATLMIAADADVGEIGVLGAQVGVGGVEPLAGPGGFAIAGDPVADVEVEGLEGGVSGEGGVDQAGQGVVGGAVGAGIAVGEELDGGGGGRGSGEEGAGSALGACQEAVIVLGAWGEAGEVELVEVVGSVLGADGGGRAKAGGGAPLEGERGVGGPLPENPHGGIGAGVDQGGSLGQDHRSTSGWWWIRGRHRLFDDRKVNLISCSSVL
jgi:hypothetical protein